MSGQAYKSMKAALESTVAKFGRMETDDLLRASIEVVKESGVEYSKEETIPAVLHRVAELGSIDAVAIMVALGCSQQQVAEALHAVVLRSEDVTQAVATESLAMMIEEWAEKEVAAGRMIRTVCPKTGENLYQSVKQKKP